MPIKELATFPKKKSYRSVEKQRERWKEIENWLHEVNPKFLVCGPEFHRWTVDNNGIGPAAKISTPTSVTLYDNSQAEFVWKTLAFTLTGVASPDWTHISLILVKKSCGVSPATCRTYPIWPRTDAVRKCCHYDEVLVCDYPVGGLLEFVGRYRRLPEGKELQNILAYERTVKPPS